MSSNKISALLITFNEINNIKSLIECISFADEIIVIDSHSTDGTLDALKSYNNVEVMERDFKNFADQRNFAISQAKHPWLLFIDADERITPELKEEIIDITKTDKKTAGFMFRRSYFYGEKRIRFSGFQTDTTYRLFRNGKIKYDTKKLVHEMPIVDGDSKILKNKMPHYSFTTYNALKKTMESYACLQAKQLFQNGKKAKILDFVVSPVYKFLYNYIIRLGVLDGKEGFIICYLNAYGAYYRYKELKRIELNSK